MVKWFINEKYSDLANQVREDYLEGKIVLYAPELLHFEVINALIYSNLFSDNELHMVNESLANYQILIQAWDKNIADIAMQLAIEFSHPIYDVYYLALAKSLNCKLITADSKFYRKFIESEYLENLLSLRNYRDEIID